MFRKISKIIFLSGKSYLLFIFVAMFLSVFSYMLSSNIILSVNSYLTSQVKPLLGGDVVINAENDIIDDMFTENYGSDFYIAETIEVSTTIFDADKKPALVDLVYRDDYYPVYDMFSFTTINPDGSIVVSQEIYDQFGSVIEIFGESYTVLGITDEAPLGEISFFSNFESMYMPLGDFDTTLNTSNSRLNYKTYLKFLGDYDTAIIEELKDNLDIEGVRIRSLDDRNETIGNITDRLYLFINFFNLIVFILTFFITILSLETFYKKLKNTIGLLSILGLKKTRIFVYSLGVLILVCLAALFLATIANLLVTEVLKGYYDFFDTYNISFFKAIGVILVVLFVGIYSPFYKVYVSDIQGLLSDKSLFSNFSFRDYTVYLLLIGTGFFMISMISSIGFVWSMIFSISFLLLLVLLYIVIGLLLRGAFSIFKKYISPSKYFYTFDAIRSTVKPGNVSFLIVFSSFISFLAIFVFTVFSGSFLSFLNNLTAESNDMFVVNISKDYRDTTYEFFGEDEIYEIVPLRIKEINDISLADHLGTERVSGRFSREFLSLNRTLDDSIIDGQKLTSGGVSVDEHFSIDTGINLGDKILFTTAGIEKELLVQNIRTSERNGANPFFYFSLYPSDFEKFPKNYFVSYDSKSKPENIQFEYSQAADGTVSFIDTGEIIAIVLDVASKILIVVYVCLIYIYVFSIIAFLVSISFLRTFKTGKLKLLYTLGASKRGLLGGVFTEYSYLIIFGLALSCIFGTIGLLALAHFIDFFSVDAVSYLRGLLFIGILLGVMMVYLRFSKKSL